MLRRLRRPTAALCAVLLVPALAACGGSDEADDPDAASSSSSEASGAAEGQLDEVSFSGEVGESITAKWNSAVETPEETAVTTLVKGDGDAVAAGDTVSTYLWVGNGTAQEQVFSDYDNGAPESIPNDPDQLDAVFSALFDGQTYGSRVVAVAIASEVLGDGENQLGVAPTDSLVIVADLVEKEAAAPTPTDDKAEDASPDEQPTVVEKDGKPTGLDFADIDEPALDTPVQRLVLKEGDGAAVKATDTVTVQYLGSTYDAEAPFDESYSDGQPLTSPLSGLIQGWTIGLTGVKVGSRVLLQIPPAFGYGAQGSGESIPGNATLWFVIDVVKAE
ncbi:FKBP-type peptidyl-prolyl cis-trans isomerase [Nocardioides dilutus]